MKKGKINNEDRMAVQHALAENMSVKDIAEQIDRSPQTVQKYIDEELTPLMNTLSNIVDKKDKKVKKDKKSVRFASAGKKDLQNSKPQPKTLHPEEITSATVMQTAYTSLCRAGLTTKDATNLIQKVLTAAAERGITYFDEENSPQAIYVECIKRMRASEHVVKKSAGGREGMAIMTPAASARMDTAKTSRPSSKTTKNVFRPNPGG